MKDNYYKSHSKRFCYQISKIHNLKITLLRLSKSDNTLPLPVFVFFFFRDPIVPIRYIYRVCQTGASRGFDLKLDQSTRW